MEFQLSVTKAERRSGSSEMRSRLSGQQLKAIRLAAEIGNDIRKNYPEIAEEYRSGLTAPLLVAKYGFDHRYEINQKTAINAVRNALRGYFGHLHEPYPGLIEDRSERKYLAFAHNRQTGIEASAQRNGIHALTHEQRVAAGRKGGLIRGPLSYSLRIGCHALPPDVLREHLRRIAPLGWKVGGLASAVARGLIPYAPATPERISEIEFAFSLATNLCYLGPVRANFKKISEKVNENFHSGNSHYTRTTLKIALQRHRRHSRSAAKFAPDPEMLFAEKLACDPAFQIPARIKGEEIARKVNEEYHGGKPVRNSLSIRGAIRRYRQQRMSGDANRNVLNDQLEISYIPGK
jgi:hypothetical protein